VETGVIDARPEGVAAFINPLRKRFQGQPLALCLEQSKGALIHQLMAVDFIDIYPINPQAFAHFRKAFAVSGAKDDSTDAQLMWDYLLNHRDRLRVWTPEDVDTRMLGLLVEDRRKMLDLRTKLSHKLTAALKGYFPQALALMGTKVASPMACDFLQRWPSLGAIKKCRDHTLEAEAGAGGVVLSGLQHLHHSSTLATRASARPGVRRPPRVPPSLTRFRSKDRSRGGIRRRRSQPILF
jgi:transposase